MRQSCKQMRTLTLIALTAVLMITSCGGDPKKMVERRKESRAEFLDSLLTEAQAKLQATDSALQAEQAIFDEMTATVEKHRKELTATKEELEALNRKRMHVDSLKTQFDIDCGRVKFIHKKQKEATAKPEKK